MQSHVQVLHQKVGTAKGNNTIEIVPRVGHFELEQGQFDDKVVKMVLQWLNKVEVLAVS